MFKVCLVAFLALPVSLVAQGPDSASTSASSPTNAGAISSPQASSPREGFFSRGVFAKTKKDTPVGSFTASFVYRYAQDLQGADRSQMGWSATPEVNFTKYIGLQAEFTGLYTRSIVDGTNQVVMAAGPRFTFAPRWRATPFVFAEGGEVRTSDHFTNTADWNPVAIGGIGLDYKITRNVSFQLIPGEYMATNQDNGNWNNSFVSKAGVTFNLFR